MQFYDINIFQAMIFRFYTVYIKHEVIKIGNQTQEKIASARLIFLPTVVSAIHIKIPKIKLYWTQSVLGRVMALDFWVGIEGVM